MTARLRVESDDVGASFGKQRNQRIYRLHHQVHIDTDLHVRTNGFAHQWANREVGHVVVVHHVKVHQISTGTFNDTHLFAQTGEVG